MARIVSKRTGAIAFIASLLLVAVVPAEGEQLAVAWNQLDGGPGRVNALVTHAPWPVRRSPLPTGKDSLLHFRRGRLFVLSRSQGTLSEAVPGRRWRLGRTVDLGPGSQLEDFVVTGARTAYLTRRNSNALLRVDLRSGAAEDVVDLGAFADADGIADLGAMSVDRGRLFVQIRRFNEEGPFGFSPPAYVAVVDLASESLVDVDPAAAGVQAIELRGTAPKHRMQVVPETRQLFISATGGFFDAGGLEVIDLDTLQSEGLIVREADGFTGADLGPFVMVTPTRGFLAYSTDLDLSSHLKAFSLAGGVEEGPERHVTVGYAMPALVYDAATGSIFAPDGAFGRQGIFVFDSTSGERRNTKPIATDGPPTDLVLLRR